MEETEPEQKMGSTISYSESPNSKSTSGGEIKENPDDPQDSKSSYWFYRGIFNKLLIDLIIYLDQGGNVTCLLQFNNRFR